MESQRIQYLVFFLQIIILLLLLYSYTNKNETKTYTHPQDVSASSIEAIYDELKTIKLQISNLNPTNTTIYSATTPESATAPSISNDDYDQEIGQITEAEKNLRVDKRINATQMANELVDTAIEIGQMDAVEHLHLQSQISSMTEKQKIEVMEKLATAVNNGQISMTGEPEGNF